MGSLLVEDRAGRSTEVGHGHATGGEGDRFGRATHRVGHVAAGRGDRVVGETGFGPWALGAILIGQAPRSRTRLGSPRWVMSVIRPAEPEPLARTTHRATPATS